MDREAWHAVIHGVAMSQTQLGDWTELNWTEASIYISNCLAVINLPIDVVLTDFFLGPPSCSVQLYLIFTVAPPFKLLCASHCHILSAFLFCHFPVSSLLKVFTVFPTSFHPRFIPSLSFFLSSFFFLILSYSLSHFHFHYFTRSFFALGFLYLLLLLVYSFPLLLALLFAVTFLMPLPYQTYSFFSSFCIGHFSIHNLQIHWLKIKIKGEEKKYK